MCIIIAKESGQLFPTWGMLYNAWKRNPHGAGFLHHPADGDAYFVKGLMTWDKFREALVRAEVERKDYLAIHFRWATSGARDGGACHPFPLSGNRETLRKRRRGPQGTVMFHNGVIGPGTRTLSDTMLMAISLRGIKFDVLDKHAEGILKPEIKGNKNRFLFYDMAEGRVRYVGKWVTIGGYKCSKYQSILPLPKGSRNSGSMKRYYVDSSGSVASMEFNGASPREFWDRYDNRPPQKVGW